VARRAGELQISRYHDPGEVREKAPKDFATEVDLLWEALMVNAIEERYPADAILSEERDGSVSESGRNWLLDPVDGTANYMKANPMFCACVTIIEGGSVTHAAVAAPRRPLSREVRGRRLQGDRWQRDTPARQRHQEAGVRRRRRRSLPARR
jgi:fructose-1,6-bisphosphatase/inositol monophosphatase family enzyme